MVVEVLYFLACWSSWSGCPPVTWEITGSSPVQAANKKKMAKKRNRIIDRILEDLTPEKLAEMKQRRLDNIKAMTMEYQIGWFIGDEIARRYMPSLDVDMIQTSRVIKVDPAEKARCQKLHDAWWAKREHEKEESSAEWQALRAYHQMLEDKYLPKTLDCHIQAINYQDEEQLKLGIVRALWASDICSYNCSEPSDVEVKLDDEGYFTIVTLHR